MKTKNIFCIVIAMLIISSICGHAHLGDTIPKDENEIILTYNSQKIYQDISVDYTQIYTYSPPFMGIDIEANEVYLSSQPGDVNKQHIVTNPQAGQQIYIHWVFTISGSGSVNSFYFRVWLRTQSGYDVIDVEILVQNPQPGYIYTYWFENPWTAPGGNYILSLTVDIYNNVNEDNENNNYTSLSFTVTPTNLNFDLEAKDVWLSSQPYDWDKNHVLTSPLNSGTEVFFYFHWIIHGVPETIANPYYLKLILSGPDGFEYETLIDNPTYRKAGYSYKGFLSDEGGNGWFAVSGSYMFTFKIDSQNDVLEWNESNNEKSVSFNVVPPFYFVHITDLHYGYYGARNLVKNELIPEINSLKYVYGYKPAFVLITGDLLSWGNGCEDDPLSWLGFIIAAEEENNSYQLLRSDLDSGLDGIPYYCCPGNHDGYIYCAINPFKYIGLYKYGAAFPDMPYPSTQYIPSCGLSLATLNSGSDVFLPCPVCPKGTGLTDNDITGYDSMLNDVINTFHPIYKVTIMHHPTIFYGDCPFGYGGWDLGCISNNRQGFMDKNEIYDVDLVCSGHIHSSGEYYRKNDGIWEKGAYYTVQPDGGTGFPADTGWTLYETTSWFSYRIIFSNFSNNQLEVYPINYLPRVEGTIIGCPTTLHLYDSYGNHVGFNETGFVDFEIENSTYYILPINTTYSSSKCGCDESNNEGHPKSQYLNWSHTIESISNMLNGNDYVYRINGTGNGTFNFYLVKQFNHSYVKAFFEDVSINNGSIGKLYVNNSSVDFTIYMDDDGDGIVDREIKPNKFESNPPFNPNKPEGPTNGKVNVEYTYTTSTTDPDGDQVYYWFDWGDGTNSGWVGPFDSGAIASATHIWRIKGTYTVKVKTKDVYGTESSWSDPLPVSMPRIISFKSLFMKLLERFPYVFPILRHLLTLQT